MESVKTKGKAKAEVSMPKEVHVTVAERSLEELVKSETMKTFNSKHSIYSIYWIFLSRILWCLARWYVMYSSPQFFCEVVSNIYSIFQAPSPKGNLAEEESMKTAQLEKSICSRGRDRKYNSLGQKCKKVNWLENEVRGRRWG